MGVYGYPIEIQALFFFALRCARQLLKPEHDGKELIERIDKRITALSYHMQNYYWLDFTQLNNIYRYKTEEYSHTTVNKFNVIPESIPDWVFEFMPLRGGYFIGNEVVGSASFPANPQLKHGKLDNFLQVPPISSYCCSCTLEFDGASKGNPGQAGAGAVLRAADGSMVFRLREGVGVATNNVAEYRGCILGLRFALSKGFKHICVRGDSKLVCMQVQGQWRTKTQNMTELCKIAKELKDQFLSFQIQHIDRECNTEADAQANLGVHLKTGEVQVEYDMK